MNLSDFKDKTWSQACELLKSRTLLVACTDDSRLIDVAKLVHDHGEHAGAAYISALLYVEEHGALNAISLGTSLYKQLAEKKGISALQEKISEMEGYTVWGCSSWDRVPKIHRKVSMMPPKARLYRHAGYMNFLLLLGGQRLQPSISSEFLVRIGVWKFLNWICLPENWLNNLWKKGNIFTNANVSSTSVCKRIRPGT